MEGRKKLLTKKKEWEIYEFMMTVELKWRIFHSVGIDLANLTEFNGFSKFKNLTYFKF